MSSEESEESSPSLMSQARGWLARKLSPPGTQTFVEGGGRAAAEDPFDDYDRDDLEDYEKIYERGGPVAALIDTRALMAFGTGAEFVDGDENPERQVINGELYTPSEYLESTFEDLDNLLVEIGKQSYIYGDALGEIVETRGGRFSHVELINPKTMDPFWDQFGRIHLWRQTIETEKGDDLKKDFPADEIAHIKLISVPKRPTGISLIDQNWDEIHRFARNQEAIANAIRLHGFPKYHVRVGREGAGQIPDKDLRAVQNRFKRFDEKTVWTTGRDIEVGMVDERDLQVEGFAEHDLMILAAGFGVPEEMAGLGRGSTEATAKVRLQAFERNARAEQRKLADQFMDQVVRPVLKRYSPFAQDVDVDIEFGDVVSDQTATAEWLNAFREYYTVDEVREKLGDGPAPEDEDLGPPGGGGGGFGDLFGQTDSSGGGSPLGYPSGDPRRSLKRVYIEDPSQAPEGATVKRGERGGIYYETSDVPSGAGDEPAEGTAGVVEGESIEAEDGYAEWEQFEPGDEQFMDYDDFVAFEADGDELIGHVREVVPQEGLVSIELPNGDRETVDMMDVVGYRPKNDKLDTLRNELRDHAENAGIGQHSSSLTEYSEDGSYRAMQSHLRGAREAAQESPVYDDYPEMETVAAILATATEEEARMYTDIQSAATTDLPREITVYRGLDVDEEWLAEAERAAEEGFRLKDDGFQSTSLDRDVAKAFGNVTLEVRTDHGAYLRAASEFAGEDEVLLPAGTEYEVEEVDRESGVVRVVAHGGFNFKSLDVDFIREIMEEEGISYGEAVSNVI